jgi:predicted RNase H-like HicB family nuclease
MRYAYITWTEEGQWTAHSPSVPGVYGVGRTRDRAVADLGEALDEMFDYLAEIGERAPRPRRFDTGYLEL